MTKIVYNACFGGFSLTEEAFARYKELGGTETYDGNISRTCPILVQVVEEQYDKYTKKSGASGGFSDVQIRDLPPGTKYRIDEYDGNERVYTPEDYEWSIA